MTKQTQKLGDSQKQLVEEFKTTRAKLLRRTREMIELLKKNERSLKGEK